MAYPFLQSVIDGGLSIAITCLQPDGIKEIQTILQAGGYLKDGKIDGIMGLNTKDAFVRFKKDNFLEFPDKLGPSTAGELIDLAGVDHPVSQDCNPPEEKEPPSKEIVGTKTGQTMVLPNGEKVFANELIVEGIPLTWGEMTKNCTRIPETKEVLANLQVIAREFGEIRQKAGVPLIINSGYRPPSVNRAIGGARFSQHINGLAIDISPAPNTISLDKLWEIIKGVAQTGGVGDGRYRGFIHRDRRLNNRVIYFGY